MRGRVARIWRQERGAMRAEAARAAPLHDARGFHPSYVAWRPPRKTAPILRVVMSMDVLGERLEMQGGVRSVQNLRLALPINNTSGLYANCENGAASISASVQAVEKFAHPGRGSTEFLVNFFRAFCAILL